MYRSREELAALTMRRLIAVEAGKTWRAWMRYCNESATADLQIEEKRRIWAARSRDYYRRNAAKEIHRSKLGKRRRYASLARAGLTTADLDQMRQEATECAYCARAIVDGVCDIDHVVPLSQGGTSGWGNLLAVCCECNRSKADKTLHVWLRTQTDRVREHASRSVAMIAA